MLRAQIKFARWLVASKCDLLEDGESGRVAEWLRRINPRAAVFRAPLCQPEPSDFLGAEECPIAPAMHGKIGG